MLSNSIFLAVPRLILAANNAPPIRRGDNGDAVALLQHALVTLGYPMPLSTRPDGSMDGIFGGEMEKTVKNFQIRNTLVDAYGFADGIVGKMTMGVFDALVKVLSDPFIALGGGGKVPKPPTPTGLDPSVRMSLPESGKLRAAYESFRPYKGHICRRKVLDQESGDRHEIRNQCAIRMSVALGIADCGFNFAGYSYYPHLERYKCSDFTAPHITNATKLFEQIERKGLIFEKYYIDEKRQKITSPNKKRAGFIHGRIKDRKGILFLSKCFGKKGSHIDYWDGSRYMNNVLHYNGPGEPPQNNKMIYDTRHFIAFLPVGKTD